MTDERDDLLSDLRTELAGVVPSPTFTAAVRARVAETSTRRRWLTWASAPVALAAGAVVLAAISVARVSEPELPIAAPVLPAAAAASSVPDVRTIPGMDSGIPFPESIPGVVRTTDPFAVQVPPDQAIALRLLLVALRERRAVVPAPTAAWSLDPLPELEALIIPPLQLELLPGTPASGGGRKTP